MASGGGPSAPPASMATASKSTMHYSTSTRSKKEKSVLSRLRDLVEQGPAAGHQLEEGGDADLALAGLFV